MKADAADERRSLAADEAGHEAEGLLLFGMGEILGMSRTRATDEDLLEELRRLRSARGGLSMSLVEASCLTRSPNVYIRRFGSLAGACERIGCPLSARQRAASARFRTTK